VWKIVLAFYEAITQSIWSLYEKVVNVEVKDGLLPSILRAKTSGGHRSWTECYNDLKFSREVNNCIRFLEIYHSSHLDF